MWLPALVTLLISFSVFASHATGPILYYYYTNPDDRTFTSIEAAASDAVTRYIGEGYYVLAYYQAPGIPEYSLYHTGGQYGTSAIIAHDHASSCPVGQAPNPVTNVCEPIQIIAEKNLGPPSCSIGNPCNPATGNKYQTETDYRSPDGTLNFTRAYNSGAPQDRGLGVGWSTPARAQVEITSTRVIAWRGDGRGERFTKDSTTGQWQGDADGTLRLTQDAAGYTLTHPDGADERYTLSGQLLVQTSRTGLTTTYSYNAQGQLQTLTGPFGHTLNFTYDASGHLATLTDPGGQIYRYGYDANNNLTRVTYPDGAFKTYHYENAAYPHHLTGITDENGNRFATWGYDAQGRAISTEHAVTDNAGAQEKFTLQYDSDTQTTVTDAVGAKEILTFEIKLGVKNLLSRIHQTDGKGVRRQYDATNNLLSETDAEGRTTTYTYNSYNQRISMTEAAGTPEAHTTTHQYLTPDLDLPTQIQTPSVLPGAYRQTTIRYDAQRNPIDITQAGHTPAGQAVARTVRLGYNSFGQVTQIDGPRLDVNDLTALDYYACTSGAACGQIMSVTNALNQTTTYDAYDGAGRLLQMTDPNGIKTSYAYDPRGRVLTITVTLPSGAVRVTHYTYDAAGQVTAVTTPDGVTLSYSYDAAHYLRSITDTLGNRIDYRYDLKGNRTQDTTRDPDGTLVRQIDSAYDARNRVSQLNAAGSITQQVFDAVGNLTQTQDPNTHTTTHHYDALNRLLETVDALAGHTQYTYDAHNNLTRVTAPNQADTQYAYDDLSNLLNETGPDRGTLSYSYDSAGNRTAHTDARGITATYTYDALHRPTFIDYPGMAEDITYTYDTGPGCTFGAGRLCQVQDQSGLTQYAYDPYGNITQETHTELGITYTTRYSYDAGDRVSAITYPSGRQVSYQRDALGRIIDVTATVNGQSTILTTNRTYRADGLLTTQTFGNGLSEQRSYDLQGRLTRQSLGTLDTRAYTYDPAGNVTAKQGPGAATYTYDALHRLTEDASRGAAYGYDPNGNRLSETVQGLTTPYGYPAESNRLLSVGNETYTLDAAGNRIGDQPGKKPRTLHYTSSGRLAQVQVARKILGTYRYNAQGLRTHKALPHRRHVLYHYDLQGHLLSETDETGVLIRDYVWADSTPFAQLEAATRRSPEQIRYLHTDHLTTPRLATDVLGKVVWAWDGNAFGTTLPNEDPDGDRQETVINLRFPGQYYDAESGLYYNWNRYYDPATGRYITVDPIGLAGGPNPYQYAESNPLKYIDPTGLLGYSGMPPGVQGGPGQNTTPSSPSSISQIGGAISDFASNLYDLKYGIPPYIPPSGASGVDKYFHCKANCQATQRGSAGESTACTLSDFKEWYDQELKRFPPEDSAADQQANRYGRNQGSSNPNSSCSELCEKYRSSWLPPRY